MSKPSQSTAYKAQKQKKKPFLAAKNYLKRQQKMAKGAILGKISPLFRVFYLGPFLPKNGLKRPKNGKRRHF